MILTNLTKKNPGDIQQLVKDITDYQANNPFLRIHRPIYGEPQFALRDNGQDIQVHSSTSVPYGNAHFGNAGRRQAFINHLREHFYNTVNHNAIGQFLNKIHIYHSPSLQHIREQVLNHYHRAEQEHSDNMIQHVEAPYEGASSYYIHPLKRSIYERRIHIPAEFHDIIHPSNVEYPNIPNDIIHRLHEYFPGPETRDYISNDLVNDYFNGKMAKHPDGYVYPKEFDTQLLNNSVNNRWGFTPIHDIAMDNDFWNEDTHKKHNLALRKSYSREEILRRRR